MEKPFKRCPRRGTPRFTKKDLETRERKQPPRVLAQKEKKGILKFIHD